MKILLSFAIIISLIAVISCNKEEEPAAITIVSITGTGTELQTGNESTVDLNAAQAPTGVPLDVVIVITFSKAVDASTATSSNITLTEDDNNVPVTVSANEAEVTVTPNAELERGTDYTLTVSGSLMAADGGTFSAVGRSFKAAGQKEVIPPQADSQIAYFKFDGDATDEMGTYDASAEVAIVWGEDRHGNVGSAAQFDGDASIIEIPEADALINTADFTISFWYRTISEGHVNANGDPAGHFVLGLGAFLGIQYEISGNYESSKFAISYELADGSAESEDMWFPSNATDNTTDGWQGWTYAKPIPPDQMQLLLKDNWLHVVYTYDASEKVGSLYFDGELMKSFDFDLWPETAPLRTVVGLKYRGEAPDVVNELAFGFIQSRAGTMWDTEPWGGYDIPTANHFKGLLDDVRFFHAALSAEEVAQLHNDED